MGEPVRRNDHPEIEPDIRPNLRVIQGGGESTPDRGNLSSVSSNTAADLRNQEAAGDSTIRDTQTGGRLSPESNSDGVRDQESSPAHTWETNVSPNKQKSKKKSKKKRNSIIAAVTGATAAAIIGIFMFLLPLKLQSFVQNIGKYASTVPDYAVKHRVKYLVTHALAARMLSISYGEAAGEAVMCKGGGIACSLYKTYTTDVIEKKFNLKMTADPNKPGLVKVTPTNRVGVGERATGWTVDLHEVGPDGDINKVTRVIDNNSEMKKLLNSHINERIPDKGVGNSIRRYISRKVEYKRFGVTRWSGWTRKVGDSYSKGKARLSSAIIRGTIGQVSKKSGLYISCILGDMLCSKTLDKYQDDPDIKKYLGDADVSAEADKLEGREISKVMAKIMENQAAKRAAGAIPFIGQFLLMDLMYRAIVAVDNGAVDKIASDITQTTYMGLAYGDDVGAVTNIEKVLAGDGDMETLGMLSSMYDGAEKSPLFAYENGVTNTAMATMFGAATPTDNSKGVVCDQWLNGLSSTEETTTIPKGQMVCENQKVVRNLTGFLNTTPGVSQLWAIQVGVAKAWVQSFGLGARAINWVVEKGITGIGWLIQNTVPDAIKGALGDAMGSVAKALTGPLQWMLRTVFNIPPVGMKATGDQNYTALSGAIRIESNNIGQYGQDDDSEGSPSGIGGKYLTPQQVSALYDDAATNEPKPSYMASLFSPNVRGSLTQQFAIMMPSSGAGVISTLLNTPSAVMASLSSPTFAADSGISKEVANNPLGILPYGYTKGDPILDASPDNYTAEVCKQMASDRENSLQKVSGVPFEVYTKSDGCALEKSAVGALLIDAGNTSDPNSLKDPMTGGTSSTTGEAGDASAGDPATQDGWYKDWSSVPCPTTGSKDIGTTEGGYIISGSLQKFQIRMCALDDITQSNIPYAAANGHAVVNSKAAQHWVDLAKAAKAAGIQLSANSSLRSFEDQCSILKSNLRDPDPPLCTPGHTNSSCHSDGSCNIGPVGYSNHGMGFAIDLQNNGPKCSGGTSTFNWLRANSRTYHLGGNHQESWHYDTFFYYSNPTNKLSGGGC